MHDDDIPLVGRLLGSRSCIMTGVAVNGPQLGTLPEQASVLGRAGIVIRRSGGARQSDRKSRKYDCREYFSHGYDSAQNPMVNWLRKARSFGIEPADVSAPFGETNTPPARGNSMSN